MCAAHYAIARIEASCLSCRPMPDNGKEAKMWEAKRLQKGSLDIVQHQSRKSLHKLTNNTPGQDRTACGADVRATGPQVSWQ